jgi:hypothetical protein
MTENVEKMTENVENFWKCRKNTKNVDSFDPILTALRKG